MTYRYCTFCNDKREDTLVDQMDECIILGCHGRYEVECNCSACRSRRLLEGRPEHSELIAAKDTAGALVRAMRIAVELIEEGNPFAAKDRLLHAIKEKEDKDA